MSGHSKWSTIKRKKGALDAKRGKIFTKLIKEITVAARTGGGDISGNARLRTAVVAARNANMPSDNVERAIKKGTGELEGVSYEEVTYEGYGPGGTAVLVETLSDNRNRTVSEIRHIFSKHNGNMGESGCVSWMFSKKKAIIVVSKENISEEQLMETALELGAEDVKDEEDAFAIHCAPNDLAQICDALKEKGLSVESSEVARLPKTTVKLEGRDAEVMMRLMSILEDHDDVQNVWANFDIDDALLEELAE
jgi:YebC/PmpR family DNA-binding regulatory protein